MHAVLATSLALLAGGPRRLVHAVLARLDREGAQLPDAPHLPADWAARWEAAHGADFVLRARVALGRVPATDLSLKDPAATADWAARLGGESFEPGHVRLAGAPDPAALPGFEGGHWWVQDLAARRPAVMLGDVAGRRVLDLCAAPGGKTMQLAAAGARVTAVDRDGRRLRLLANNLGRTGLAATLVESDVEAFRPGQLFDAVLLDAPCTATGTFRRHPEVLHRRRPADAAVLAARQRALLAHAAALVAPGGRLVYAVCSIEPEEGRELITHAAALGLVTDAIELLLPGPADGFAIASFTRTG